MHFETLLHWCAEQFSNVEESLFTGHWLLIEKSAVADAFLPFLSWAFIGLVTGGHKFLLL